MQIMEEQLSLRMNPNSAAKMTRVRFFAGAILALAGLAFGSGCSSKNGSLSLRSNNSKLEYSQKFTRAYYSRNENGEYDIVLLEDGIIPKRSKSDAPIIASAAAPLNQTVHIRILWRPLRGSKPDAPSATNSVIDWFVRANDSIDSADRLHYRGAGFITISESNGQATFQIKSAKLEPANSTGRLRDPLGQSSLEGEFKAVQNSGMVTSTVQSLAATTPQTAIPPAAATHDGPPPRRPAGP